MHALLFGIGGYHLSGSRRWLAVFLPLALVALVANFFGDSISGIIIREISVTAVTAILLWAVFHHSFIKKDIPKSDRILAGIAGYILLGLLWTSQFNIFDNLGIDALMNSISGEPATRHETLYFSFITLTAVGFGEIVPVVPAARTMTIFASLTGIFYLAILISTLVAKSEK